MVFVGVLEGDEAEGLHAGERGELQRAALPDVQEDVLDGVLGRQVQGEEEAGGVQVHFPVQQAKHLPEGLCVPSVELLQTFFVFCFSPHFARDLFMQI